MTLFQLQFFLLLIQLGFVITYSIGWFLSRRKPNFPKITVWATLVGAGLAGVV